MVHRAVFAGYAPGLDLRFYDYFVFLIKKTNPYQWLIKFILHVWHTKYRFHILMTLIYEALTKKKT